MWSRCFFLQGVTVLSGSTSRVWELTLVFPGPATLRQREGPVNNHAANALLRRTNFFGSLFKTILKIIAIVLIIIAIVYGFYALLMYLDIVAVTSLPTILVQGAVMVGITNITWFALAAIAVLALSVAALVDIDTVTSALSKVREAIGSVVDTTVGVVTDTVGSVLDGGANIVTSASSSLLKLGLLVGGVIVGWKFLKPKESAKANSSN